MRFVPRRPDRAYYDTHLWLPTEKMGRFDHLRASLTFEKGTDIVEAWAMEANHVRVPRNFMSRVALERFPFPIIDTRFRSFPKANLRSKVKLDAREPDKTYQTDGANALLKAFDGILSLRCGAGKTPTALHAAAQLRTPILVLVNDTGLAKQWIEEICWVYGIRKEDVGYIGDGKFVWQKEITVATVQTIARRALENNLPLEMIQHFGIILCDEAHVMGAPYFNAAVPAFHGRRWGLSATPVREDQFDPLLKYTFGPVVYSYLIPELTPTFLFKKLNTRVNLDNPAEAERVQACNGDTHLMKMYGFLAEERPLRVAQIAADIKAAMKEGRQVIALTHSKAMCAKLAEHFTDAGVINSDVKPDERIRRIRECNPVIAIMQCGKQALNKPVLDTLMLCEPTTKEGVLQQIMGRILRPSPNKKAPVAMVYEDQHIEEMRTMCGKIRRKLNHWPASKGGQIPYKVL